MENSPIKTLVDSWPARRVLADEIDVNLESVHKWASSGRIPAKYQERVIRAAQKFGLHHVTAEWMVSVHAEPIPDAAE
ncbi:hypothetical protein MACH17_18270 [Phaeobacter inhibens]|nr:hypothetical protein MACH17_18270 [Phaeobacter inhibens]